MQARSETNLWGIDVSHWQGEIDWQRVAATGVQFAFVKATDGPGVLDPLFRRNAGGAHAVGLKVGFYHYAHVDQNVNDEIDNFVRAVSSLPCDLPHVLDLEETKVMSADHITAWALQWLQGVQQQTNHPVMIYTGAYFARDNMGQALGEYPLWVAQYGPSKPLDNSTWDQWAVFQYSQSGKVDGISGPVDQNVMEASFLESLQKPRRKPPMEQWLKDTVIGVINDLAKKGRISNPELWIDKVNRDEDIAPLAVILINRMV